jgi:hypothetical protein
MHSHSPHAGKPRRRIVMAAVALAVLGVGARTAFASTTCVDVCIGAFGVSFYNSEGDYFILKDCATSSISGTTYCTYARLKAIQ